jgi:hypothetical protein
MGVDHGGLEVAMMEGLLDQEDIACALVEGHGEGVAQGVGVRQREPGVVGVAREEPLDVARGDSADACANEQRARFPIGKYAREVFREDAWKVRREVASSLGGPQTGDATGEVDVFGVES